MGEFGSDSYCSMSPKVISIFVNYSTYIVLALLSLELQAKFTAEEREKVKAIEKYNEAQHQCSMLELDIKSSRDEVKKLTKELEVATEKVRSFT